MLQCLVCISFRSFSVSFGKCVEIIFEMILSFCIYFFLLQYWILYVSLVNFEILNLNCNENYFFLVLETYIFVQHASYSNIEYKQIFLVLYENQIYRYDEYYFPKRSFDW